MHHWSLSVFLLTLPSSNFSHLFCIPLTFCYFPFFPISIIFYKYELFDRPIYLSIRCFSRTDLVLKLNSQYVHFNGITSRLEIRHLMYGLFPCAVRICLISSIKSTSLNISGQDGQGRFISLCSFFGSAAVDDDLILPSFGKSTAPGEVLSGCFFEVLINVECEIGDNSGGGVIVPFILLSFSDVCSSFGCGVAFRGVADASCFCTFGFWFSTRRDGAGTDDSSSDVIESTCTGKRWTLQAVSLCFIRSSTWKMRSESRRRYSASIPASKMLSIFISHSFELICSSKWWLSQKPKPQRLQYFLKYPCLVDVRNVKYSLLSCFD